MLYQLSPRECAVVRLIRDAKTNKEIAYQLGISPNTVKSHVSNILQELNFCSRLEILRWAMLHPEVLDGEAVDASLERPAAVDSAQAA